MQYNDLKMRIWQQITVYDLSNCVTTLDATIARLEELALRADQ